MIKKLLSMAAMALIAVSASADEVDILPTFGSAGWGSSYNAETKTITFDDSWKGRGWWLDGADYSKYDKVVVEFEPVTYTVQLVIEYSAAEGKSSTANVEAGVNKVKCEFDPEYKSSVKQIYVQNSEAGTLTLTAAYLLNGVVSDPNLLWDGNAPLADWKSGGDVTSTKVKAGDVITYVFTGTAEDGGQALVKNDSWKDVIGTAKINAADMNTGKVVVGVTNEMLASIGTKFFLQGEKGATLTKVERTAENGFDVEKTLYYGERAIAAELFFTIPEEAASISVVLDKKPEWIQLCNGSWTTLIDNDSPKAEFITNADNTVTMNATIDADFISAINASKKMVINGKGASVLSVTYDSKKSGIADITIEDENAPVEYFNLQGVRVENPTNGLYIRRQGNKVTKVIL
ncbi:hypothetical protein [Paramuribaculum intestinale]|uniref:hypothetical protein n=1 Tax=Paramuribaculum intestinale TaxID=2094151 RepID=UPI0026F3C853|nr:hypothetical protein [Paramuribaculum intestinale]